MDKIKMTTPLVEMDGDEMTRILWADIPAADTSAAPQAIGRRTVKRGNIAPGVKPIAMCTVQW